MTNRSRKHRTWLGVAGLTVALVACGGRHNLGSDRTNGAAEDDAGSAGVGADDVGGSGGNGGSGGPFLVGGAGIAGSVGENSLSPRPGVACDCDEKGDSVCHGSLASLCVSIPGCKPALADVRDNFEENVCSQSPLFATYTDDTAHIIVEYGLGAENTYRMIFASATGELVGAALSGYVGYACNLAGKTEFVEGMQVAGEPTCRLCANEEGVGGASDQASASCPW